MKKKKEEEAAAEKNHLIGILLRNEMRWLEVQTVLIAPI
jgi:hypothetical protein